MLFESLLLPVEFRDRGRALDLQSRGRGKHQGNESLALQGALGNTRTLGTDKPRNPRHFDILEGGGVYLAAR